MRTQILVIGAVIFAFSIIGYMVFTPGFTSKMMSSFMPSTAGSGNSQFETTRMFTQMGFPSFETIDSAMQFSSLGLAIAAVGVMVFGTIAKKKIPKKIPAKTESDVTIEKPVETKEKPQDMTMKENLRAIRILQERLAKGEITPKEFEDLKRFLE
jgi:hypothetical protein